jgi:nucleoside-diphosphate-sugar epimerase
LSRILVAGAAGFLGSHLCRALLDRGDEVVGLDNLVTGTAANLTDLTERTGFEFLRADIVEPLGVDGPLDAVMNLASPASPKDFATLPVEILQTGSVGTHNLIRLAMEKAAVFFMASTSEVYGDPIVHPQAESYWGNVNPIGPRSVYDEAKRFSEALTMAYHRRHGLDVRMVRIFNTYGPRMRPDDGRVVSTFLTQALVGKPLTVYGDGSQTRSFCYVDDEVSGFVKLLDSAYTGPVNIGNPDEFTMLELADKVLAVTGSGSDVVFEPLPEDDPTQRKPDISLARNVLGWEPVVALEEGLRRTAPWFEAQLAGSQ